MPQQLAVSVENNFTKGLITESTGLNFPENAATDADNCQFTLIGDVLRRQGINFESGYQNLVADRTSKAMSTYTWSNAGGDSTSRLLVKQIGGTLYFYNVGAVTSSYPLSTKILPASIDISQYSIATFDATLECMYADGNGYLFVFHPSCDPVYITYASAALTSNRITVNIRDFTGIPDNLGVSDRPPTLSAEHQYNLINQGWSQGAPWAATSTTTQVCSGGAHLFTIATGITGISVGDTISFRNTVAAAPGGIYQPAGSYIMSATVSSYTSGTGALAVNVYTVSGIWAGSSNSLWTIIPGTTGKIDAWHSAIGNYPSNADQWWYYKNNLNVFDPGTTVANVTLNNGSAPKGHTILNAFNQQRNITVAGITTISTNSRPDNGTWFQGRVWYTGVSANQPATGDAPFYTWSENIYFSQIVQTVADFGNCYQTNDPTGDTLFDILPTDGGVITIASSGKIYKLFPIANGLLVFAGNGVWFITGSQGIGFTANDYTITKISSVKSISNTSFVDVMGLPYFWNEEGIYQVQTKQSGGLGVEPITVGTILSFYNTIPYASKAYVRGDYDPIEYVIQWSYRSTQESSVTTRYQFDKLLNYNVYNKAFYPYGISDGSNSSFIHGVNYISYPNVSAITPDPGFKYHSSYASGLTYNHQFAQEYDTTYNDWGSSNYISYFITGYKLRGQAIKKFQPQYVQVYFRTEDYPYSAYNIQGIWDFSNDPITGRWTTKETVNTGVSGYNTMYRRHKIRGRGFALQIKVSSQDRQPFDIQGWAIVDTVNSST